MKKLLLAFCFMVLAAGAVPAFAQTKIALVNMREVLNRCDEGAKKINELRAEFGPRQEKLNQMKKDAVALQEQLKAKNPDKPARSPELEAKVKKLAEEDALFRRNLAAEEEARLKPVVEKITNVVREYAKEKGLTGVQDRAMFLYADPSLDITEEILKRVNQAR